MSLNVLKRPEKLAPENGVYKKDGKWLMRFDNRSDGAEIPAEVAHVVSAALKAERFAAQEGTTEQGKKFYQKMRGARAHINCHETALYAVGLIHQGDPKGLDYDFGLFPLESYKTYSSAGKLAKYVRGALGKSFGVIQKAHDWSVTHTLLAGLDSLERCVCFEKEGHGLSWQILPLEEIYRRSSSDARWAAGSIDSIMQSEAAKGIRTYLDKWPKI
ncbi:hypothetical protein A3A40_01140 [Candidatus Kaiserbacteria bacterium RIFCSPLOWO2_01_FULL_54_20]|uniref:Uncharacterized protein n=1 Tax=Candidatus Kaiserbacteria bacterium RIFCSPLOWO2_01_FULL_54_20 TaxID=1798513 RepID=A0A1F6EJZ0_9BACT|nr:MAG: hypothetical protein A3A40_01140 [Candidatus Kaiserbacteria bacterium RIFCSPLOWO2_01_FULL_54_20]